MKRRSGLVILALVGVTGAVGFRFVQEVTDRPGESALKFVPANALGVGVVDFSPSVGQLDTFRRIDAALERGGLNRDLDGFINSMLGENGLTRLAPLVKRNGLVFMLPDAQGKVGPVVALIAVDDDAAALAAIGGAGRRELFRGTPFFRMRGRQTLMPIPGYVAIGEPAGLAALRAVQNGAPSILTVPGMVAARATLPREANVALLGAPSLPTLMSPQSRPTLAWTAVGGTLRPEGMEWRMTGHSDPTDPQVAPFLNARPLADLSRLVPSGAYATLAASDISAYARGFMQFMGREDNGRAVRRGLADIRRATGLGVREDWLPAFTGNTVLGAYPRADGTGIELLAIIDAANGATPAAAAERLLGFAEEQLSENASADAPARLMEPVQINGHDGYTLDERVVRDVRRSLREGVPAEQTAARGNLDGATFEWVKVGNAVVGGTSRALLTRATAGVATPAIPATGEPNHISFTLEPRVVADGIDRTFLTTGLDRDTVDLRAKVLQFLRALQKPLTMKAGYSPDGKSNGSVFVPIDWDLGIDAIANARPARQGGN